jgi:hypothetical protein
LWKVVLVVLTFFGGIGVLIYLLAWLLLPAESDTASPVEALAGRGYSRTSSIRTIVGLVIAALMFAGYVTEPFRATPLVAMVLLGGVLLLLLHDQSRGRGPGRSPAAAPPPAAPPPAAPPPAGPPPAVPPPAGPAPAVADPSAARPGAPWVATPVPPGAAGPFAPQGPFAPPGPSAPPPVTPPPAARWQPAPQPPRPRSRLGLLTISVAVLLLGAMAVVDLAGYPIAPLAYFAVPLAVLGVGLVVGAWVGRARWLIPLGIVLMLALGSGYVAFGEGYWSRTGIGVITLQPESVEEIPEGWYRDVGAVEVDMSRVDFAGTSTTVEIRVGLGAIQVIVPSDVDVTVDAAVNIGSANVFDEEWNGLGAGARTVTDLGRDGPGGGELHIAASVNTGAIEIRRY